MLESLTPVEADAATLGRVLFEPEALEQQLEQLMTEVAALRERVQHLVGMVPDDAVQGVPGAGDAKPKKKKNKKKNKKKSGKQDKH